MIGTILDKNPLIISSTLGIPSIPNQAKPSFQFSQISPCWISRIWFLGVWFFLKDGEFGCDFQTPRWYLPSFEAKNGCQIRRKADPTRASLGFLLYHASQGFSQLCSRYSTARHGAPERCKYQHPLHVYVNELISACSYVCVRGLFAWLCDDRWRWTNFDWGSVDDFAFEFIASLHFTFKTCLFSVEFRLPVFLENIVFVFSENSCVYVHEITKIPKFLEDIKN